MKSTEMCFLDSPADMWEIIPFVIQMEEIF